MKARCLFLFVALALIVAAPITAHASFLNLNFEGGSGGWDFYNPPGGTSGNSILGNSGVYHPGITIDPYLPPEGIAYLHLQPDGPGKSEVAAQSAFFSTSGALVQAVAAFDGVDYQRLADYTPDSTGTFGDDAAYVEIYTGQWTAKQISEMPLTGVNSRTTTLYDVPWERRVWGSSYGPSVSQVVTDYAAVGDFTSDPWTIWNSKPLDTGWYTLVYRIESGDEPTVGRDPFLESTILKSHALFDAVPEARTCFLFGLGLLFAVGARRRSLKGVNASLR